MLMWTAALAVAWKYALVVAQIKAIITGNLAAHVTKRKIMIGFGAFYAYGLLLFIVFLITISVSAPKSFEQREETYVMIIIVTCNITLLTVILLASLYYLTTALN